MEVKEVGLEWSPDVATLAQLFETEADRVYGFVLNRAGSPTIAEDVTSDVFAEAARRFSADRGDEVTPAWLTTVARRRLIDRWRAMTRHRRKVERVGRERIGMLEHEVDDEDDRVLDALSSLADRQRAVLTLRYFDEFSVGEVAEALLLSYQATESLLARARRSFAQAYEEAG